mmetsp:Transcript_62449/g.136646  ORF Transcript_62449/g.136646 Transcript_62449/m.136646 type:complete len:213 (+) Transcript_62449:1102-1740(+)
MWGTMGLLLVIEFAGIVVPRIVIAVGATVGAIDTAIFEAVHLALSAWTQGLDGQGPVLALLRVLVKAHATHVQKMQIARVVEGFDPLKVGEGMDGTNVVQDDVQDEAHPMFMGFLHQFLEIIGSSKVRIDLGEIFRPIAVVAIATLPQIGAIEILHHRGDPNAIPAHTTDIVQMAGDSFQGAVAPSFATTGFQVSMAKASLPTEAIDHDQVY